MKDDMQPADSERGPGRHRTAALRTDLQYALQETDPHRPLDSLETTVVLAYFAGQGFDVPADSDDHDLPTTIEGWLQWADRSSPGG